MDYKCVYCKDEGWVVSDCGLNISPCPMNCKVHEFSFNDQLEALSGGKTPVNFFSSYDPDMESLNFTDFDEISKIFESAKPKFMNGKNKVGKVLVFGTSGSLDNPHWSSSFWSKTVPGGNPYFFPAGSFERYLPAVIYTFDCFNNFWFYSQVFIVSKYYNVKYLSEDFIIERLENMDFYEETLEMTSKDILEKYRDFLSYRQKISLMFNFKK